MTRHRTHIILPLIALIVLVSFWPAPAHAAGWFDAIIHIGSSFVSDLLQIAVDMLQVIHTLLVKIIEWGGNVINWMMSSTTVNYGGAAVYNVWKVFRDMCNGLFIVLFIFVAFGTIFNVVWKNPFYYQSALTKVILAAVLINFSLPIGQTVVWAGNAASTMVTGLMKGQNINVGRKLLTKGPVLQTVGGDSGLPSDVLPQTGVPANQLTPVQKIVTEKWASSGAEKAEKDCLANGQDTISGCAARGGRVQAKDTVEELDKEVGKPSAFSTVKQALSKTGTVFLYMAGGAPLGLVGATVGGTVGLYRALAPPPKEPAKPSPTEQAMKILSSMVNIFFLSVLAFSFLLVIVILLIRIPMTWLYLAASAIAFFFIAIPGSKRPGEWFGNLFGWSIFGPLYLFVIYIGMFMLDQQTALLSGLTGSGFLAGFAGVALFYVMVGAIFIGGAGAAWKYAFSLSKSLEKTVGAVGEKMGIDEKSKFGISTLGRYAGYDRLKATAVARGEKLQQVGRNIGNRVIPDMLRTKSYEQLLADKRAAMGVYGGAKEVADISSKQVGTETDRLKSRMATMAKDKQDAFLRGQANSSNRNVALAAREMLLARGSDFMTDAERSKTRGMYPNEGAKRAWDDKVKRSRGAAAREKKKESQEKREDIIADVGAIETSKLDASTVKAMLDPYFDPPAGAKPDKGEQAAYVEALGLKDPSLLFDYLQGVPGSNQSTNEAKAFAQVIKKPENALDLPEEFFSDPNKNALLQKVMSQTYTGKKRDRAKDRLLTARPEMADVINNFIFP